MVRDRARTLKFDGADCRQVPQDKSFFTGTARSILSEV